MRRDKIRLKRNRVEVTGERRGFVVVDVKGLGQLYLEKYKDTEDRPEEGEFLVERRIFSDRLGHERAHGNLIKEIVAEQDWRKFVECFICGKVSDRREKEKYYRVIASRELAYTSKIIGEQVYSNKTKRGVGKVVCEGTCRKKLFGMLKREGTIKEYLKAERKEFRRKRIPWARKQERKYSISNFKGLSGQAKRNFINLIKKNYREYVLFNKAKVRFREKIQKCPYGYKCDDCVYKGWMCKGIICDGCASEFFGPEIEVHHKNKEYNTVLLKDFRILCHKCHEKEEY